MEGGGQSWSESLDCAVATAVLDSAGVAGSMRVAVAFSELPESTGVTDVQAENSRQVTTDPKICSIVVLSIKGHPFISLLADIHRAGVNGFGKQRRAPSSLLSESSFWSEVASICGIFLDQATFLHARIGLPVLCTVDPELLLSGPSQE